MSVLAVETPSRGGGQTIVKDMASAVNHWVDEPRHDHRQISYYPREQSRQSIQLPPPSSLVADAGSGGSSVTRYEAAGAPASSADTYISASLAQRPVSRIPISNREMHPSSPPSMPHHEASSRLSPTSCSTTSDRSEDIATSPHALDPTRDQNPSQTRRKTPTTGFGTLPPELRHFSEQPLTPYPTFWRSVVPEKTASQKSALTSTLGGTTAEPRLPSGMKIADLLSEDTRASSPGTSDGTPATSSTPQTPAPFVTQHQYRISVRQQPAAARSCGFGDRDRRAIDPPPIVQLTVDDPDATPAEIYSKFAREASMMHCTIWNEAGDQECAFMEHRQRRLMGTVVASPFVGEDENGVKGCFFCFPDLSCRTPGTFRLRFSFVVMPSDPSIGSRTKISAFAMSDKFTVYHAKDFPGMTPSSALTKKLKDQGCLISIKKGHDKGNSGHNREDSPDDDDGDGDCENPGESSEGRRKRQRKVA